MKTQKKSFTLNFNGHFTLVFFISGLFSDAVNNSDYIGSNDRMINNKLERMCLEVVMN
jgi:hypothetical protein